MATTLADRLKSLGTTVGAAVKSAVSQPSTTAKSTSSVPMPSTTTNKTTSTSTATPQKSTVPMPSNNTPTAAKTTTPAANAATNPGSSPATGYGGATYGTSAEVNKAIEANQAKLQNDPNFRASEIARTLAVIDQRKAQGLDTSEQEKYLTKNLGYSAVSAEVPMPNTTTTSTPNPGTFTPPQEQQYIPTPQPSIPVMDKSAIEKYSEEQIAARLAAMRQAYEQAKAQAETDATQQSQRLADQLAQAITELETYANQATQGITTSYERARTNIGEDRSVEDVSNARRLSPFSGRSDFALGIIEQERARTDREMLEDLETRIGNINQETANRKGALTQQNTTRLSEIQENLANFRKEIDEKIALAETLAPQERDALYREIANDERNYELMLRGEYRSDLLANSQLNNDAFTRALEAYNTNRRVYEDDRNFDRSVYESDRNFDWSQYLDVVDRTGNINPSVLSAAAASSAASTASTARANPYAALMDTGGSQRTLQGQAMDLQNKQANLDAALAVGEASGRLVTPTTDWGGLFRQANNADTPLNLSGRQFQSNEQQRAFENDMARKQFAENVRQFGIEAAARQAGLSLEQARIELAREDNARQWVALDYQMQQDQNRTPAYNGATVNQVIDSLRSQYFEPVLQTDALGQTTKVGDRLTQDATKREDLFLRIASMGLPYEQENQAMLLMGLSPSEIAAFDKKYGFTN